MFSCAQVFLLGVLAAVLVQPQEVACDIFRQKEFPGAAPLQAVKAIRNSNGRLNCLCKPWALSRDTTATFHMVEDPWMALMSTGYRAQSFHSDQWLLNHCACFCMCSPSVLLEQLSTLADEASYDGSCNQSRLVSSRITSSRESANSYTCHCNMLSL